MSLYRKILANQTVATPRRNEREHAGAGAQSCVVNSEATSNGSEAKDQE
jgi:hypothetical protein